MTEEAADEDLLLRSAAGDHHAFARLVVRHQSRLMAMAVRLTGSRVAAEDAVQECFTRAWTFAPRWRRAGPQRSHAVAAWLARMLLNLITDERRRPRTASLDGAMEPVDSASSAEEVVMDLEQAARVRAAVSRLPTRQATALSLAYDAELSNAQGAEAMMVSLGAFELLLVRARRALRTALKEGADD